MTAFVAMPFAHDYDALYGAISRAALQAGVVPVRADELLSPGPIINQIFDALGTVDCMIAEVGSRNPNVYYELALAHCVQMPSILVSREDRVTDIPFDIRHNRIILYEEDLTDFVTQLTRTLTFVKDTFILSRVAPTLEDHLQGLAPNSQPHAVLTGLVQQVGQEFGLVNPRLQEQSVLHEGGYSITIADDFGDRVVFQIDVNGNIRRKRRLT